MAAAAHSHSCTSGLEKAQSNQTFFPLAENPRRLKSFCWCRKELGFRSSVEDLGLFHGRFSFFLRASLRLRSWEMSQREEVAP